MATISEALAIAIEHHRGGRLPTAEQVYRQILQADPNQLQAIFLLGGIAYQTGRHSVAVDCFRRAIELKEDVADFHHDLAKAYHMLRRFPEAVTSYRRALELRPGWAEAHNHLGGALMNQRKLEEAAACFRRALALQPEYAEAHSNLGGAFRELGKLDEAVACYQRALELKPESVEPRNNLGLALKQQGKPEEAIACYRRALDLQPGFTPAHINLGNAFRDLQRLEDAADCFRRATEIDPQLAVAHNNLGSALKELGKLEEALDCYHRALTCDPTYAQAHNNLGLICYDQGKPDEAIACFRRTLASTPDWDEARLNLAVALLLLGQYEEGWRAYEARFSCSPSRNLSTPRWNQEPMNGGTIFLTCEQGFGDTIHFLRYAALVRERTKAGRVILECQPSLSRLLAFTLKDRMEIVSQTKGNNEPPAEYDRYLPLLSLPWALGLHEPLGMSEPYLRAAPALRATWKERLGPASDLRVGLAWKGNRTHERDRLRSLAGGQFLPLLKTHGARFHLLQIDADPNEIAMLTASGAVDLAPQIVDFADTAAIAAELDLIISVDTALVHLAGALGRPVWTLLPFVPDWRWGVEGESTPWYPSMRLFRQTKSGDWDSVLRRIGEELEKDVPLGGSRQGRSAP